LKMSSDLQCTTGSSGVSDYYSLLETQELLDALGETSHAQFNLLHIVANSSERVQVYQEKESIYGDHQNTSNSGRHLK